MGMLLQSVGFEDRAILEFPNVRIKHVRIAMVPKDLKRIAAEYSH